MGYKTGMENNFIVFSIEILRDEIRDESVRTQFGFVFEIFYTITLKCLLAFASFRHIDFIRIV